MTTAEAIVEIENQMKYHASVGRGRYAVLKPLLAVADVDFNAVAKHFKTEKINSYTMTDKVVIEE